MKILLLGKNGQVGHALQHHLLTVGGEVVALGRNDVDVTDLSALKKVLDYHAPSIIVNAVAYTAVDKAETEEHLSAQINAEALVTLSAYAKHKDALLVHYSTDYVFDGEKTDPYLETDLTNPQNVYGRTKRLGEEVILNSGCKAFIFRTSWVYSAHGNNFVKTMLRLAVERDSLNVVADQIGAPTSADLIARLSTQAIRQYIHAQAPLGLYHLTAAGYTSWHGFACQVVQRARTNGLSLKLHPDNIHPVATSAYPLPAKRPKNSRLDTSAFVRVFGEEFLDWRVDVDSVVDELVQHSITPKPQHEH